MNCIHRLIGSVPTALVVLGLSSTLLAQDPNSPAATPAGQMVELSLIVTDANKKSVNNIRKEDVRVVENKVDQTVLSLDQDERPVDCGLLIDSSGSMRSQLADILEAARQIIASRRPGNEFFIERFISSDKIQRLQDFTSDGNGLIESLKSIKIEAGQSAIIDALYAGGDFLARHNRNNPSRRKVLVLISDGEDRNSFYKTETLLKGLRTAGIQVFAVGFTSQLEADSRFARPGSRDKAERLLKTLVEETGGRVFFPKNKQELIDATTQINNDLRSQFRITYQSSGDIQKKGFRKVEVKLNSSGGEKRVAIVPRGYYVGP